MQFFKIKSGQLPYMVAQIAKPWQSSKQTPRHGWSATPNIHNSVFATLSPRHDFFCGITAWWPPYSFPAHYQDASSANRKKYGNRLYGWRVDSPTRNEISTGEVIASFLLIFLKRHSNRTTHVAFLSNIVTGNKLDELGSHTETSTVL